MENSCFKVAVLFSVLWFGICQTKAQNLVPNPSFEEYSTCPSLEGQVSLCIGWLNPNQCSPDYFNGCANTTSMYSVPQYLQDGYLIAKSGNAYTSIFTYNHYDFNSSREYLQGKLIDSLQKKKILCGFLCLLGKQFICWRLSNKFSDQ
jgi:hypothetical protein